MSIQSSRYHTSALGYIAPTQQRALDPVEVHYCSNPDREDWIDYYAKIGDAVVGPCVTEEGLDGIIASSFMYARSEDPEDLGQAGKLAINWLGIVSSRPDAPITFIKHHTQEEAEAACVTNGGSSRKKNTVFGLLTESRSSAYHPGITTNPQLWFGVSRSKLFNGKLPQESFNRSASASSRR